MRGLIRSFSLSEMLAVQRIGRWVLVVVAVLATMHGLLHVHPAAASYSHAAAQNCALCVSTESGLATVVVRIAPPAAIELVELPVSVAGASSLEQHSLSSRGPPHA